MSALDSFIQLNSGSLIDVSLGNSIYLYLGSFLGASFG